MARRYFTFSFLMPFAFVAITRALAVPTTQAERPVVAARTQELLGIPPVGNGVVKAVLDVHAFRQKGEMPADHDTWDRIADEVLLGSMPDELNDHTLEKVTVSDSSSFLRDDNCPYGTLEDRAICVRRLWDTARKLADQNEQADRVRRYTRAALAISVNSRFGGAGMVDGIINAEPRFQKMAQVDDRQMKALREVADAVPTQARADLQGWRIEAAEALDRMIHSEKTPLDAADQEKFLSAIKSHWPRCGEDDFARWKLANLLWRFTCLAKGRQDDHAVARVTETARELRMNTQNVFAQRWLDEVLSMPGPVPTSSGVHVIHGPNDLKPNR